MEESFGDKLDSIQKVNFQREIINGKSHIKCEMCCEFLEASSFHDNSPSVDDGIIDGGSIMKLSTGFYTGFNDMATPDLQILLCHDCTLRVYRLVPKLKGLINLVGLHPVGCCVGKEFDAGEKIKREYVSLFQRIFPEMYSDEETDVEWPIFEYSEEHDGKSLRGGCEWSW